jgi:DnaK suppressor protein
MAKSSKAKLPKKTVKPVSRASAKRVVPKSAVKLKPAKQKGKAVKLATKAAKPKASVRAPVSSPKRIPAKPAPRTKPFAAKKAVVKKSAKPAVKKPVAATKPLSARGSTKIDPKGKKIQKPQAGREKPKAPSAIAVGKVIVAAPPQRAESHKNGPARKRKQSKVKNFLMSSESKNNQKEVSPGGGLVQPATKSAPAMNLRADDAVILASAKERYNRKDLDAFKTLIIEQLQEAKEEFEILSQNILDTSGEFEADNQNYSMHTAEQGTDAIEREKTFLHAQRTSDYIKRLEEAIERIDRGIYGICVVCGGLIEKERLQAVPITQKHVDCKNRTQTRKPSGGSGFREREEQPPANVE